MALIVELGTGMADAESYASVAAADARCAALGLTAWAGLTEAKKEEALRKATLFMTATYRTRWMGRRMLSTQALDWPRYDVCVDGFPVLSTIVPAEVVGACIDLAARAGTGTDLSPDVARLVKEKTIGPIKTVYADGVPATTQFRAVDLVLRPFLESRMRMVRA